MRRTLPKSTAPPGCCLTALAAQAAGPAVAGAAALRLRWQQQRGAPDLCCGASACPALPAASAASAAAEAQLQQRPWLQGAVAAPASGTGAGCAAATVAQLQAHLEMVSRPCVSCADCAVRPKVTAAGAAHSGCELHADAEVRADDLAAVHEHCLAPHQHAAQHADLACAMTSATGAAGALATMLAGSPAAQQGPLPLRRCP